MRALRTAARLSRREREVVLLLRTGRLYRAIAFDMAVKERSVREYIERAYRKLGVSSRYELR